MIMQSRPKAKILLFIAMLSVICSTNLKVSASVNSDISQSNEVRNENAALNEHLFVSVGLGSARMVESDLMRGANIHALDRALQTPLHFIIRRIFEARFLEGSLDVLDTLLEYEADPDFRVNSFTVQNIQTPYEYFETHYSNDTDQVLVAAVRQRLDDHRMTRYAPALQRRRLY